MKPIKITREQYEVGYKLGVKKLQGEVTITDAVSTLQDLGVNKSSAADLIYNATHLIRGCRYTRMLSVEATNDYLTWILQDFHQDGLKRALSALWKHIRYYEHLQTVKLHAHRMVWDRHSRILSDLPQNPTKPTLEFEWMDRASRGWIDSIPHEWFRHEGTHRGKEHILRRRKDGESAHARCDVTVHSRSAELDYEAHEVFNQKEELFIGTARIGFADTDRSRMVSLEWRAKGMKSFKVWPFRSANFLIPDEKEYHMPSAKDSKKLSMHRERPGQALFRTRLKGAYKHRCCITGCDVPDVLEGAHIDDYRSAASNNLKNGLLLRADIHTLFDRNLLAIDPSTHLVHLAVAIRNSADYLDLHGEKMQLPENLTHYPSQLALERRWQKFTKSNA